MAERYNLGISYLTEKTGADAIDESIKIQNAIGETLRSFGVKFVVIPEEMLNPNVSEKLNHSTIQ